MGEDNIQLGEGQLFISTSDELFAEIKEGELTVKTDDSTLPTDEVAKAFKDLGEITFTATISVDKLLDTLYRITDKVLDNCPNRRVAHLARYHKNYRTRKKNIKRAFRIAEKRG